MPKGGQAGLQLGTAACTKSQGETTRVGAQRLVAREHGSEGPSRSSPSHGQQLFSVTQDRGLRTHPRRSRASPGLGSPWHDLTGPVLNPHTLTEDPGSYSSR